MELNNMTDEQLASLIDNLGMDDASEKLGHSLSLDDLEIVNSTKRAKEYERKPSWIDNFKVFLKSKRYNSDIFRDIRRLAIVPSCCVVALLFIMLFSPLSQQYNDMSFARGFADSGRIDSLIQAQKYQCALALVDVELDELNKGLPKIAYFDRFHSKQDRYEIALSRAEIYELQWKKIEILSACNDHVSLRKALKDYASIIGYHQAEAQEWLKQLGEK